MIIGIDPDIKKSGVAIADKRTGKIIHLDCLPFFGVIGLLDANRDHIAMVGIEAGWTIKKSNWHPAQGLYKRERIAKNVGENHCVGKLLAEYCHIEVIPHQLVRPQGKLNHKMFCAATGWLENKHTNQEKRDAGMIALWIMKSVS